jgi:hypothetical protein
MLDNNTRFENEKSGHTQGLILSFGIERKTSGLTRKMITNPPAGVFNNLNSPAKN